MPKNDNNNSGLSEQEIALIKAMLRRGKAAGFTAQKILTYFSRPDRTINVARLYEIKDGKRGVSTEAASDAALDNFLHIAHASLTLQASAFIALPWTPAPAYLELVEDKVSVTSRVVVADDPRVDLREKLLAEQRRLALELEGRWSKFQVDQRLKKHIKTYAEIASGHHSKINIFSLNNIFVVISRSLGNDTEGLGEIGEVEWDTLSRNHAVLTDLYPEMREYRAALAKLDPDASLAEEEARQAVAELTGPQGRQHVAPEVSELIQNRLDEDVTANQDAARRRTYDVTALLNTTGARLVALIELLPKIEKGADAAIVLWNRYWPLLKTILQKAGWL